MPNSPLPSLSFASAIFPRTCRGLFAIAALGLCSLFVTGCTHTLPPDPMAEAAGSGEKLVAGLPCRVYVRATTPVGQQEARRRPAGCR